MAGCPDWLEIAISMLHRMVFTDVEEMRASVLLLYLVMKTLQAAGVAAGAVSTAKDIYEDPQLQYRGHFWGNDDAFTYEAPACRLSKTPTRFYKPQPRMGQYNDYVFTKLLELSEKEYTQYRGEGIIT